MKYKLVVFDLDGTILNTLPDLCNATNFALDFYGYKPISLAETKKFIGSGIKNLIRKALKLNNANLDNVLETFKEFYCDNCLNETKPYDGMKELLLECKEAGIKLAVFTNKAQKMAEKIVNHYYPNIFQMVIGQRTELNIKPDPKGLFIICEGLSVSIQDTLYIGDSDIDVKTANNAKCQGVFVSYGYRTKKDLFDCGAQEIVDNVSELRYKLLF